MIEIFILFGLFIVSLSPIVFLAVIAEKVNEGLLDPDENKNFFTHSYRKTY